MRLGFIGTGTITAAVVTGLLKSSAAIEAIWVTPRNAQIAAQLAQTDDRVHIGATNQEVVDRCKVICLAIRPQVAQDTLAALQFSADHQIMSFIATYSRQRVQALVSPARQVVRMAPLPTVAERACNTIIFPPDPVAAAIFSPLGGTIEVADERAFDALFAVTGGMASYFGMLQTQAEWLVAHGIAYADARRYLASLYFGVANAAKVDEAQFSEMSRAYTTPGGLNEQVFNQLAEQGVYRAYQDALERIFERIQGESRPAD